MTNRAINRKVVADYFNYFLDEYSGLLKVRSKMKRDLENARDTFALDSNTINKMQVEFQNRNKGLSK